MHESKPYMTFNNEYNTVDFCTIFGYSNLGGFCKKKKRKRKRKTILLKAAPCKISGLAPLGVKKAPLHCHKNAFSDEEFSQIATI